LAGFALQRLGVPLAAICIAIAIQAVMLLASVRADINRGY
jgi:hypothetical protein